MAGVAAVVALLVALLIEGCVSEHAKTASATAAEIAGLRAVPPVAAPVPAAKQLATPPPHPVASSASAPSLSRRAAPPTGSRPAPVYVVKSGDTLIGIARLHHTTATVLKAINGLDGDLIVVGARLKLPSA